MTEVLASHTHSTSTFLMHWEGGGGAMSWFGQTVPPAAWPKYRKPPYPHRGYAPLLTRSVGCFRKTR